MRRLRRGAHRVRAGRRRRALEVRRRGQGGESRPAPRLVVHPHAARRGRRASSSACSRRTAPSSGAAVRAARRCARPSARSPCTARPRCPRPRRARRAGRAACHGRHLRRRARRARRRAGRPGSRLRRHRARRPRGVRRPAALPGREGRARPRSTGRSSGWASDAGILRRHRHPRPRARHGRPRAGAAHAGDATSASWRAAASARAWSRRCARPGFGDDDVARVHSPIGLAIGAETPARARREHRRGDDPSARRLSGLTGGGAVVARHMRLGPAAERALRAGLKRAASSSGAPPVWPHAQLRPSAEGRYSLARIAVHFVLGEGFPCRRPTPALRRRTILPAPMRAAFDAVVRRPGRRRSGRRARRREGSDVVSLPVADPGARRWARRPRLPAIPSIASSSRRVEAGQTVTAVRGRPRLDPRRGRRPLRPGAHLARRRLRARMLPGHIDGAEATLARRPHHQLEHVRALASRWRRLNAVVQPPRARRGACSAAGSPVSEARGCSSGSASASPARLGRRRRSFPAPRAAARALPASRCFERRPLGGDLPDQAGEYLLGRQDCVCITGSAVANKTLPRLLELSRSAYVVLVGPSVPLAPLWFELRRRAACRHRRARHGGRPEEPSSRAAAGRCSATASPWSSSRLRATPEHRALGRGVRPCLMVADDRPLDRAAGCRTS